MKLACHYLIAKIKLNRAVFHAEDVERGHYAQRDYWRVKMKASCSDREKTMS